MADNRPSLDEIFGLKKVGSPTQITVGLSEENNDPGTFLGTLRGIAQGASFNLADEIESGLRAPLSDRTYDEILSDVRSQNKAFSENSPWTSFASEVLGGAIPAVGGAIVTGGLGIPALAGNTLGKVAGLGAIEGGLSGFGAGEDGLGNRLESSAIGGAIGGGIGAGVKGLSNVLGGATQLGGYFDSGRRAANAARELIPNADDIAPNITPKGGVTVAEATSDPSLGFIEQALFQKHTDIGQGVKDLRQANRNVLLDKLGSVSPFGVTDQGVQGQTFRNAVNNLLEKRKEKAGELFQKLPDSNKKIFPIKNIAQDIVRTHKELYPTSKGFPVDKKIYDLVTGKFGFEIDPKSFSSKKISSLTKGSDDLAKTVNNEYFDGEDVLNVKGLWASPEKALKDKKFSFPEMKAIRENVGALISDLANKGKNKDVMFLYKIRDAIDETMDRESKGLAPQYREAVYSWREAMRDIEDATKYKVGGRKNTKPENILKGVVTNKDALDATKRIVRGNPKLLEPLKSEFRRLIDESRNGAAGKLKLVKSLKERLRSISPDFDADSFIKDLESEATLQKEMQRLRGGNSQTQPLQVASKGASKSLMESQEGDSALRGIVGGVTSLGMGVPKSVSGALGLSAGVFPKIANYTLPKAEKKLTNALADPKVLQELLRQYPKVSDELMGEVLTKSITGTMAIDSGRENATKKKDERIPLSEFFKNIPKDMKRPLPEGARIDDNNKNIKSVSLKNDIPRVPNLKKNDITKILDDVGVSDGLKPLVHAIIKTESGGKTDAVSPKGARGLMQLMPAMAKAFDVTDSFNPEENVKGGVRLLTEELMAFDDPLLAIAAYNAGRPAVMRAINRADSRDFDDIREFLPKETREYVVKVLKNMIEVPQIKTNKTTRSV